MLGIIDPETGEPITLTEYSKATGIPYGTLSSRLCSGMPDELIGFEKDLRKIPCRDHKGNEYESMVEMARAYGMPANVLDNRLRKYGNIEKALTMPYQARPTPERQKCVDPNGKEWPCLTHMCRAWGVRLKQFKRKKAMGMTLEECLNGEPLRPGIYRPVTDPKGRRFDSWIDLAAAWGVNINTLRSRVKHHHWPLEKALTTPQRFEWRKITDPEGREFSSLTKFCKFWGVAKRTARKRLALGMEMKDVLKDSSRMKALREGRKHDSDAV